MPNGSGIEGETALLTDDQSRDLPQLAAQWASVRGKLQNEVGDVEYRAWLRQMTLVGLDGDEITITLPSRFLRDWVRSHYGDRLTALWQAENRRVRRVEIRVGGRTQITGLAESVSPATELTAAGRGRGRRRGRPRRRPRRRRHARPALHLRQFRGRQA